MDSFIYDTGYFFCDIVYSVGFLKVWQDIDCVNSVMTINIYGIGIITLVVIVVVLFIINRSS